MFVYWKPTLSTVRQHQGKPLVTRIRAVLRRCVNVDGMPHQIYLGNLAAYRPDSNTSPATRCQFWIDARQRLDLINLPPKQRRKVEAALAQRVRPPTTKQLARYAPR